MYLLLKSHCDDDTYNTKIDEAILHVKPGLFGTQSCVAAAVDRPLSGQVNPFLWYPCDFWVK